MAYTNSKMVVYTKLSPNHSGQRTHSIDRISPHCVVGQVSAESLGNIFAKSSYKASSNYGIDRDGRVGMYVEEKNRSWCTSSKANDQRAVTIECASDTYSPYRMNDAVYQTLIRLLYCTGLRLGEALELKISDIDFTDNIIIVNSGKGNVSRLVPFKASLGKWLINYNRKKSKPGDTYFFESPSGGRRCNHSITTTFRKNILPKAGVSLASANGHSRGPCIHSLRHTFACNALDQMIKEGKDPYCALPYLSVYLGHTDITNTEIYLRLTMERYDEVINVGHYIYERVLGGGSDD